MGFVRHYLQLGKQVVATVRNPPDSGVLAELAANFPTQLQVLQLDTGDEASIGEFADDVKQRNISFGIVINNAGVSAEESFGQWTAATFAEHFLVNAVGPALVIQAIAACLEQGGKVIQMSSGMGSIELNINPNNGRDAYAASKSALNILTRRLAEKLRSSRIAVFAMNPGWVKTDTGGEQAPTSVADAVEQMAATIDRIGDDATGSFLAGDGAGIPW